MTNDKLQGSVSTHLRCGGVVNNQIKKCLLRVQHSNHSATELPGKRKNRLDDTNRKASRFSSCPMLDGCVTVGDQTESAGLHSKRVGAEPGRTGRALDAARLDYCNVVQRRHAAVRRLSVTGARRHGAHRRVFPRHRLITRYSVTQNSVTSGQPSSLINQSINQGFFCSGLSNLYHCDVHVCWSARRKDCCSRNVFK